MLIKTQKILACLVMLGTIGYVLFAALPSKETKVPRSGFNWANLQDAIEFTRDFMWASQYFAVGETELGAAKRLLGQLENDIQQLQKEADEIESQADVELRRIGELEEKNKQINRKVAAILEAAELPEFNQASKADMEKRIALGTKSFTGKEMYDSLNLYAQDIDDNTYLIKRTKNREEYLRIQAKNAQSVIASAKTDCLEKLEDFIFTIEKDLNPTDRIKVPSDKEMDAIKVKVDRIKVQMERDSKLRTHQEIDAVLEKNKP